MRAAEKLALVVTSDAQAALEARERDMLQREAAKVQALSVPNFRRKAFQY